MWTTEAHMLAAVLDALHGGNWQRGGGQGKRPKPIARPSDELHKGNEIERHIQRAIKRRREREES
ncbi:MAG TPA: hypothetical protein VFE15_15570 [Marmoricola sp.]|jgi:hypothetical protein|nr:hypothetical protein [Marmoricola sp.]